MKTEIVRNSIDEGYSVDTITEIHVGCRLIDPNDDVVGEFGDTDRLHRAIQTINANWEAMFVLEYEEYKYGEGKLVVNAKIHNVNVARVGHTAFATSSDVATPKQRVDAMIHSAHCDHRYFYTLQEAVETLKMILSGDKTMAGYLWPDRVG